MVPEFEPDYWAERFRARDWYIRLQPELTSFIFTTVHDDPELKAWRHRIYDLAGSMLQRGEIPLASRGPDLDRDRKLVDTIIVHHTEEDPAISLNRLNAIGLLRQYGLQYIQNDVLGRPVRGEAVWSGHFRADNMVFFAYHWLIRPDGSRERLLDDRAIGWHAGNWDINTRSIGIALAGNYEHASPPVEQIVSTAQLLREHYPTIGPERIFGHCEIRSDLTCPGEFFLRMWKKQLLEYVLEQ